MKSNIMDHKAHNEKRTLYDLLKVDEIASTTEIRNAWRDISLRLNPDLYEQDRVHFNKVSRAYRILTHPKKRNRYNEYIVNIRNMVNSGLHDYGDFEDFQEEDIDELQCDNGFSMNFSQFMNDYFKHFLGQSHESDNIENEEIVFKHTIHTYAHIQSTRTIRMKNGNISIHISHKKRNWLGFWRRISL